MTVIKKKTTGVDKKGDDCGARRFFSIGGVTVTCAAGPMPGTKNVTVTATGVTAPLGAPATCSLAGVPNAVLKRNGTQVDSKPMNADATVAGKWSVMFPPQPAGNFEGTVFLNWQILLPESASGTANCP